MCDKKNNVLFTDTGCFVLSPNFKLANESQVLLKVPRKNNMYSVDMKNIVPKESLTCLVAKSTLDESMLWHRRLGHINYKTINKPVKDNLVRGLPTKHFENDQTCVACLKGKQHKASCTNSNDFTGTEESFGAGHSNKETGSSHDYIVTPLWKDDSLFDSFSKNASDAEPQPSSDIETKDDEGVSKDSGLDDQERPANNTQDVNTARPSINIASTNVNTEVDMSNITTTYPISSTLNIRIHKDHSLTQVIGDIQSGVLTRGMTKTTNDQGFISAVYEGKTHEDPHTCLFACFLSQEEPKRIAKALSNSAWVEAMQDELLQFKAQKVWILLALPKGKRAIGRKWIFRNKKDERARIEAIRLFLAYASFMGFMVYQMDAKSAFLYGKIEEEISSMGELTFFLGLQVKQKEDGIFISQDKYVADILRKFGFTDVKTASTPIDTEKPLLKDSDGDDVDVHLYRFQVTPKVSHLRAIKRIFRYIKGQPELGLWYPRDSPFDLVAYSDSDYARASLDRKSTTGGYQFLGCRLISWQCKKKTMVSTSSTESEYVAAASCYGQVLWI
ncbi:putative ribonuclease H-like domain-containing protein [Tanacetum coccineum]